VEHKHLFVLQLSSIMVDDPCSHRVLDDGFGLFKDVLLLEHDAGRQVLR
jgi:hypothetical protein